MTAWLMAWRRGRLRTWLDMGADPLQQRKPDQAVGGMCQYPGRSVAGGAWPDGPECGDRRP